MSSDESYFDDEIDEMPSIMPSDRVLRSSSISVESAKLTINDSSSVMESLGRDQMPFLSENKNSSRALKKLKSSVQR